MRDNADCKIREYIRRTALSMDRVQYFAKMVEKVQAELAKVDLHLPDQIVIDVLKDLSPILYADKKDLRAKIRRMLIVDYIEETRGSDWWTWLNFFEKKESLEYLVGCIYKRLGSNSCTESLIRETLREIHFEYPYFRKVLLQDIYTDAIWEIGGHFTINSMLRHLEERGLGYIDRPERAFNSLNRILRDGHRANGKNYVLAWGGIGYYPSNSHLWPDTHGFYFREARDEYDRGLQEGCCSY